MKRQWQSDRKTPMQKSIYSLLNKKKDSVYTKVVDLGRMSRKVQKKKYDKSGIWTHEDCSTSIFLEQFLTWS